MDLWIRSQDKEELIKINNRLFIKEINGIGFGIYNDLCCDDGFISLGIYETKERALEVLDIITKMISGEWLKENYPNASIQNLFPIVFFQMPEK